MDQYGLKVAVSAISNHLKKPIPVIAGASFGFVCIDSDNLIAVLGCPFPDIMELGVNAF
nr:hypothetical protein [Moorella sp. E306M]